MAYAEASVILNEDLKKVFEFILDGRNNPLWRPGVKEISCEENDSEKYGVGTLFLQEMRGPVSVKINADYKIIECDKYKTITFKVLTGPCLPIGKFIFEENEDGVKVTFSMNEAEIVSEDRDKHLQKVVNDVENLKKFLNRG